MPFNFTRYEMYRKICLYNINKGTKTIADYEVEHQRSLKIEDYEVCQAIVDVLEQKNHSIPILK